MLRTTSTFFLNVCRDSIILGSIQFYLELIAAQLSLLKYISVISSHIIKPINANNIIRLKLAGYIFIKLCPVAQVV